MKKSCIIVGHGEFESEHCPDCENRAAQIIEEVKANKIAPKVMPGTIKELRSLDVSRATRLDAVDALVGTCVTKDARKKPEFEYNDRDWKAIEAMAVFNAKHSKK